MSLKTTIINWKNGHPLLQDWQEENEVEDILSIFEGDPDMLYIDGVRVLFTDIEYQEERIVVYCDPGYEVESKEAVERVLSRFYNEIAFEKYFEQGEEDTTKCQVWYRGGKGYHYAIHTYTGN